MIRIMMAGLLTHLLKLKRSNSCYERKGPSSGLHTVPLLEIIEVISIYILNKMCFRSVVVFGKSESLCIKRMC